MHIVQPKLIRRLHNCLILQFRRRDCRAQRFLHRSRRRVTCLSMERRRPLQHGGDSRRHFPIEFVDSLQRVRLFPDHFPRPRRSSRRSLPGQQVMQGHGQRVQIAARSVPCSSICSSGE